MTLCHREFLLTELLRYWPLSIAWVQLISAARIRTLRRGRNWKLLKPEIQYTSATRGFANQQTQPQMSWENVTRESNWDLKRQAFFQPEVLRHAGQFRCSLHPWGSPGHRMFPGSILLGASFLRSPCLFLSHTSRGKEPDPSEFFCPHWSQGDAEVPYLVGLSRTNKVTREQLFATPQFPSGLQAPYLPLCLNTHAQTDTCIESPYMHIRGR